MKKGDSLILSLVVVILLITLACPKATINSLIINRETGSQKWIIDNAFLAKDIEILEVKEVKEGELLYVNLLVKNNWRKPKSAKIKLEYYDQQGIQLDNPWGWRPLILESNQDEWFKFMAPKKEVQISKIKIMVRGVGDVKEP